MLSPSRRAPVQPRPLHVSNASDRTDTTVGLTPDYRIKVTKARALYLERLHDYREMRAAVHDQLGAEMRYAGCKLPVMGTGVTDKVPGPPGDGIRAAEPSFVHTPVAPAVPGQRGAPSFAERPQPEPGDEADWGPNPRDDDRAGRGEKAAGGRGGELSGAGAGPAIWINMDNTRCAQASRLTIDGLAIGEIAGQKKVPVRTHAGPHELCLLPVSDKRGCGAPGTIRRAYLYEGWTLAVRCQK